MLAHQSQKRRLVSQAPQRADKTPSRGEVMDVCEDDSKGTHSETAKDKNRSGAQQDVQA